MTFWGVVGGAVILAFVWLWGGFAQHGGVARIHAGVDSTPVPRLLRLGLAPEQDIFKQRKSYRALADYLEEEFRDAPVGGGKSTGGYKVELATACSYAGMLKDFEEGKIEAAFMGSLVATVAVDRYHAQVALKSESKQGGSTYAGVVFVAESSPVKVFEGLRDRRIGAVRTTMAGAVFPIFLMKQKGLDLATDRDHPEIVWSGTHEDVIREVAAGHLDAGAVKDLRLQAYEKAHPEVHFRRLATSGRVPDNALVIRGTLPAEERDLLVKTLLAMGDDPQGALILADQNIRRYVRCDIDEYSSLYDMIEGVGDHWKEMGIDGPAPRRPASASTTRAGGG